MATIADERLEQLASARRGAEGHPGGDPRRRRARHRAGAARQPAPGRRAARGRGRLLARRAIRRADLETLELELLVADRDHVERRLERVEKQAKSGDAALRKEVEELGAARAPRRGRAAARLPGRAPGGARAADDEAADRDRQRPWRHRPASSRPSSPSCPRRRRPLTARAPSALDEIVRRLSDALGLITFFTAGDKETRAWTLRRGRDGARRGRDDPLRHRARLHPLRGDPLGRPARGGLARRGRAARARSGSRARPTSSRTATS